MRNRNRNRSDKSSEQARASPPHLLRLDVSKTAPPPSFFRCPISLEVMLSPVSLCTGVTYDRSSIRRWLDSGNTTCPATMQPLPSTDLIPNLTLRRLIHLWSSSDQHPPSLSDLARTLSDPAADEAHKRGLLSSSALRPSALASLFLAPETLEPAVILASLLLSLDLVDADTKRDLIAALLSDLDAATSGIVAVLKADRSPSRAAAARVLEMLIAEARAVIAEKPDVTTELVRLIGESDGESLDAGLRCLMGLVGAGRKARAEMVRLGAIPALTNAMEREGVDMPAPAAVERAMRVMEAAVGCGEGRAAFCAEAERCVGAVLGRMMKVGNEGREAAVAVLWSVCCAGGGDRRAREAAAAAKGGLAKVLVVMQGDCSPSARRMAGDLLRVFRGNDKGSMAAAGYDSKTIHIMPF